MSMVALSRKIGSAFFVVLGRYGQVSEFAREHGISRQWVYREAQRVCNTLESSQAHAEIERLRNDNTDLRAEVAQLKKRLAVAVILDEDKQVELAGVGQACGVTLSQCLTILEALIPGRAMRRATLGRRTQALGQKAGALLEVLDEFTQQRVRDIAADEIYVRDPVLMAVEQESLCWVAGRLSEEVTGAAWSKEFERLPNLEQVARDGGTALAKGVELVNTQRQAQGAEPKQASIVDQGDHFHALRDGGVGLRRFQRRAGAALAKAEAEQKALETCAREGKKQTGPAVRASHAWRQAEEAMDAWVAIEKTWQRAKDALRLITPEGELNTRAQAEAVLAEVLPLLPENDFAKAKRNLQKPEMLNYLDHVQDQLEKLPITEEVKQMAVKQELLRRQPKLLQTSTMRGVMLMCAVALSKAGDVGQEASRAVQEIFRRAYRASSLVECINSVLRMQQAQHRQMTQGLLDLKRLYWNCHRFRSGRRRNTTPYERLGVPWPEGLRWSDVLKLTPEQLRNKLSTTKTTS
jgi:cell division protein FtsB